MADISILIAGAGGRMGRAIAGEILKTPGMKIVGGIEQPRSDAIGRDIGALAGLDPVGVVVSAEEDVSLSGVHCIIDFSSPAATASLAARAASASAAHIIGTTGFSDAQDTTIRAAAKKTVIVKSGNMSLGVNLLAALVERAAAALPEGFDIEIFEAHHRFKVDAPSGTALMLGEAAASGRGVSLSEKATGDKAGRTSVRQSGDIGFSVMRGGGIIGDHDVNFAGDGEILTLSHRAIDRSLFAKGAVRAAGWAQGKDPGLYSMRDVLGLGT